MMNCNNNRGYQQQQQHQQQRVACSLSASYSSVPRQCNNGGAGGSEVDLGCCDVASDDAEPPISRGAVGLPFTSSSPLVAAVSSRSAAAVTAAAAANSNKQQQGQGQKMKQLQPTSVVISSSSSPSSPSSSPASPLVPPVVVAGLAVVPPVTGVASSSSSSALTTAIATPTPSVVAVTAKKVAVALVIQQQGQQQEQEEEGNAGGSVREAPTVALFITNTLTALLKSKEDTVFSSLHRLHYTRDQSSSSSFLEKLRRLRETTCAKGESLVVVNLLTNHLDAAQVCANSEMLQLPCVGPAAMTHSVLLANRSAFLRTLAAAGLPVPPHHDLTTTTSTTTMMMENIKFPVRLISSSSTVFPDSSSLLSYIQQQHTKQQEQTLVDSCIEEEEEMIQVEEMMQSASHRTFSVAVLGNRTQPAGGLYDNRGYYLFPVIETTTTTTTATAGGQQPHPALEAGQAARLTDIAIASVEALGLSDFARVDLEVDESSWRVVRVVSVAVLPHLDPAPFLSLSGCSITSADLCAALIQLAQMRCCKPEGSLLHLTSPSPPLTTTTTNITEQQQRRAEQEDNPDVILRNIDSSSSSDSASLHGGPSHQQQQHHHNNNNNSPPLTPTVLRNNNTATTSYKKSEVPPELWNDWRWQLSHRLTTAEQLRTVLPLTEEEEAAFNGSAPLFPVAVTPYFLSLINPDDPHDPIRLEILPRAIEAHHVTEDIEDSLGEDSHSPVPGLVHRYPDRVLMLVSMTCASYCRFCTRNRVVGTKLQTGPTEPLSTYYERQLTYIRSNPVIRDVLLSGGDPLLLPLRTLDWILGELRRIPHVEVVRIGSRVPIFVPQRVTPELCSMLSRHHPLWMNVHINHPNELTADSGAALGRLANAGIPLGSQTVLLAGINDCPNIMMELVHKIVANRVRPYYIYQCDMVLGASHFRTPTSKLIDIMEALRGHTSGFCVPTAVIDAPHGGGKVPVLPNYVISQNETKTVVRNFEGFITTYTGPKHYEGHDSDNCKYCQGSHRNAQDGVSGLLQGHGNIIKPEHWDDNHIRIKQQGVYM